MKRYIDKSSRQCAPLFPGAAALFLVLASATASVAQSAAGIVPTPADRANGGEDAPAAGTAPAAVDGKPSRFAGSDIDSYIASRASMFSMKGRVLDPFGLTQDPTVKPPVRKTPANDPTKRSPAIPPTPLSEIVKLIRVTTIMPGERKFLVGVRSFSESDEFSLNFRGKLMRMKIMKVSSGSILFQNIESGETASLETGLLPPGMVPGSDMIQPPGMVSPLDDVPLELGTGNGPN